MVVHEAVVHLAPGPLTCDHPGGLQDSQMLTDQGLRHLERVHQFVHAARGLMQLQHDRDADRRREGAEQFARGVEDLAWWQLDCGHAVVAVVVVRRIGLLG
jgi:hypothetical protein